MCKINYCNKEKRPKTKTLYVCTNCGSPNVQFKSWVNANTGICTDGQISNDINDNYCLDCESRIELDRVVLKPDAYVIGYQVIGQEGTSNEGEIHPNMDASFCVYNLSQARDMLNMADDLDTGEFRLLTIWNNDIEEPTMMFLGSNPRD